MDFGAWIRPTLIGPFVTWWALVTAASLLGAREVLSVLGARFDSWVMGMLVASFLAAGLVVLLVAADVMLLKAKLRMLPSGQRAWTSSLMAPVATMGAWSVWPFPVDGAPLLALAIVLPMIAAAFGTRFLLGKRP